MFQIIHDYWLLMLVGEYPRGFLGGLALTGVISGVGLLVTFPAAIVVALCRTSGCAPLRAAATAYVYGIRAIPQLMLIFWAYFFVPVLLGFPINAAVTLIVAIVINQTAYLSEIIRGGIEGLPRGQVEAARALGLGYIPITARVVLPQALYNVLPGIINQLTSLIKDSSLGAIIAVGEITYVMMQINSNTVTKSFQVFALLAACYFVLCFSLSRFAGRIESRIATRRKGIDALEAAK
ncbi:MAG: amino acid ABC transporter permease [Rhodocyclaceae bacterium]